MTNEQSGVPMGRHAQKQPPVNQVVSQLSQSLPVVNIEDTAPQYTGNPVITLDHVTKIYEAQPNNPALSDISLHIFPGEFVFLVGHSGSGKSTFINLLIRQIKPTKGKIYIADEDLTQMRNWRVPYLRRNIGCVFQDFKLLPNKTVFENVAFALEVIGKSRHVIRTQVPEVLRLVGLQDKMNKRPDQLSGGEQQRVSIARAIVNRPPLLICDEPTGNLDPQNSRGIMDLLERINRTGTTVLVATHDREMVDNMRRRVIALDKGVLTRDQDRGVVNNVVASVENQVSITAYVKDDASDADIEKVKKTIEGYDGVESVSFTTKDQALDNFRKSTSNPEIVDQLDGENPLPASIDVQLDDAQSVQNIASEILANQDFVDICDNADDPTDSLQYGQKTVDKLFSLTNAIRTAGIALIALLIFIAFIFINNTIRLAILARRKEIAIMRLVGASNGFIRGPFLAEGALHALIGALLAIFVLEIARNLVLPQMAVALPWLPIGVDFGMFLLIYLAMLVAGLVIGLLGSLFAMSRYLKV